MNKTFAAAAAVLLLTAGVFVNDAFDAMEDENRTAVNRHVDQVVENDQPSMQEGTRSPYIKF